MKIVALTLTALLGVSAAQAGSVEEFDRATNNAERSVPSEGDFENPAIDEPGYVHNPAECSAPGTDQYSVIVIDNGAGRVWHQTNDTRWCPQAGVQNDPVFKADGN